MNPADQKIETLLRDLRQTTSPEADERTLAACFRAVEERALTVHAARRPGVFWRLAAAAVIVLGAGLVLFYPGRLPNGTSKVYAMSDVPSLLRQADTVHIQGWLVSPQPSQPPETMQRRPFEYWFHPRQERMQFIKTVDAPGETGPVITREETVIDGSVLMHIDHTAQTVRYRRLSDFARQFMIRQNFDALLRQVFLSIRTAGSLTRTGSEQSDGIQYEVWEGTWNLSDPQAPALNLRVQFDPATGNIGRMSIRPRGQEGNFGIIEIAKIERNINIPEDVFSLQPPAGYAAVNTIDSAGESGGEICMAEFEYPPYTLHLNLAFLLNDGSVLLCWRNEASQPQADNPSLFADLKAGGPLPALPVVIEKLAPLFSPEPAPYHGVHLVSTEKNGRLYEWSLYVPSAAGPENPVGFKIIPKLSDAVPAESRNRQAMVSTAFTIEDDYDFDKFVIGAMRHFCDGQCIPEGFDYPYVLSIADQVRDQTQMESVPLANQDSPIRFQLGRRITDALPPRPANRLHGPRLHRPARSRIIPANRKLSFRIAQVQLRTAAGFQVNHIDPARLSQTPAALCRKQFVMIAHLPERNPLRLEKLYRDPAIVP